MKRQVEYFEKPGRGNTEACVAIVKEMVEKENYAHVVVASTTGDTARAFADALPSFSGLTAVTHSYGFKEPNAIEFDAEIRRDLDQRGVKVLTTTILTHSLETALTGKFQGVLPTQIMAHSLRRLGEGTKVCCEIVMEAADAGAIPEGENVVAIAGTGHGADTVCVIRSATSKRFLDLFISEIRAKPM